MWVLARQTSAVSPSTNDHFDGGDDMLTISRHEANLMLASQMARHDSEDPIITIVLLKR